MTGIGNALRGAVLTGQSVLLYVLGTHGQGWPAVVTYVGAGLVGGVGFAITAQEPDRPRALTQSVGLDLSDAPWEQQPEQPRVSPLAGLAGRRPGERR